ncbi:filamentous hemagglutinin N-terminal domain-containing protein [Salmonella enterica]|nr:filamentous hemagglutinin N-terminal domain-containing protein [Salmonella enterica]EKG3677364.1 filamentous hemagglutinin N-terminal domain-containing protein [Salmonella enterica]
MNKIYKLKYDRRRNQLVAVSELTTGAGKEATGSVAGLQGVSTFRRLMGTLTPLAVLTGLVIGMLPGLALANPDLPVGGQVVAGQGSISTSGNQMTIHQGTHGLVTNWHSFDIGQNHTVQFVQPDSSAVALNRVTGGHESQILGTLTANGQVMLVNPAGVMFGKGARVNTAGLLASTKNISTEDFMAGRYTFSGGSHPGAEIVNQGSLTTTKGGYIVLAADRVRNSGTLSTPSGKTVLAAADRVTLQLDNTGLASVSVNGSVVNALVENSGLIAATNGQVYLTARGKDMLLNTVVNNSGTVEARGLNHRGGEIVLDGGESGVVSQSGMLLADSETGRGGKITVQGANIHLAGGSRTSATGRTGGGGVYVGGGWQGKDVAIRNASKVVMDRDAVIDVSATEKGDGGKAVLWSEDYTNFRGRILAKGGAQSGNGGQVETSSHHNLQAFGDVDASAAYGNAGEWLLDPFDISIVSGSTDTNINDSTGNNGIFTPDAGGSQVSNGTINARLNGGTNVTIKTAKENSGSNQWGNITVNADINHTDTNNVSLTLNADGNINITNHNITSSSGKLDVNLSGAGSHDGTITLNNASITTNGGNITLGQWVEGDSANTHKLGVSITNHSVLNAATTSTSTNGNIILTANNGTVLGNATLNGGNITLNVSKNGGIAFDVICGTMSAVTNLTLTGNATGAGNKSLQVQNSTLSAGDTISLTGEGNASSYGGLNVGNINFSAGNTLLSGNATSGGVAVWLEKNINVTKGNLTVTGKGNSGEGITGFSTLKLNVTTGNLTLNGSSSGAVAVNITNAMLTGGNVTLSGTSGTESTGSASGVLLNNANLTASSGNISVSGKGFDSGSGALSVTGNNNFSAQNTVLSGEAGRNNVGTLLGGNLNVTQGNLSVTGTSHHYSSGSFRGLKANVLNLTVSSGSLSLTGKSVAYEGRGPQSGAVAGLELINTCLSASSASLMGSSVDSGSGFILNNVTLNGGIEHGVNLTLSSAGSSGGVINVIGSGVLNATMTETLMKTGIENVTQIDITGISLGGSGDDWINDYTGTKGGGWIFNNAHVNKSGNISLKGVGFVNSTLTATNLTLTNENTPTSLTNTSLQATNGNVTLQGVNLVNSSVTANGNLTIDNKIQGLLLQNSTLNSTGGNISLSVNSSAADTYGGIKLINTNLSADSGDINVSAVSKKTFGPTATGELQNGGLVISGNNSFSARNSQFSGTISSGEGDFVGAIYIKSPHSPTSINVTGNATFTGKDTANNKTGIYTPLQGVNISVSNGNLTLNGSGWNGFSTAPVNGQYADSGMRFVLSNANVTINAKGTNEGIGKLGNANDPSGLTFSGVGNVTVNAVGISGSGIRTNKLDNSGLTGSTVITGESKAGGKGIFITDNIIVHLTNATVTGKSATGEGVTVNALGNGAYGSNISISGGTLTGESAGAAAGVNITGKNVNVSGGANLTGSSAAGGDGVKLNVTAGNNYTLDGATVTGTSMSGSGVNISGALNATGTTNITGNTTTGNGVNISGNLTSTGNSVTVSGTSGIGTGLSISGNNVTITNGTLKGTSGGSGAGVQLTGGTNYTVDGATVSGQSQAGNGVSVGGNLSVSNGTVSGMTATGSGVDIGGDLNTVNTTITGNASGNGSGVSLNGNVTGDLTEKNMITGHSGQGNGVLVSGNSTATNVVLNGDAVDGNGIKVTGNLTTDNVVAGGNATGNGSGISLAGNVTGGHWAGNSSPGTGVSVSEDSTLSNVMLSGTTDTGTGVSVTGNLTSAGSTTVSGNATGAGTGASVSGTLNGNIAGSSDSGAGTTVNGTVNGMVSGTSTSGTGAVVGDGANITQNSQVNGQSGIGTGSSITGNVTSQGSITGITNGTGDGVNLAGNVSGGTVVGNANNGTGVNVSDDNTLTDVTVSGKTASGSGVRISGSLTSQGTTTVDGAASGSGIGIHLKGDVTDGVLTGTSVSGPGVKTEGDIVLNNNTLTGSSGSSSGLLLNGMVVNTDSVLHGQSGSGDGVSLNGAVTGGSLSGQSGSGAGMHVTGNSTVRGVNVSASSGSGQGLQLDGVLSTAGGTTLNGAAQGDSSAERRQVYELQNLLSHNNRSLKQVVTTSGYSEQEKPVSVDICTDDHCHKLDAGASDRPVHP